MMKNAPTMDITPAIIAPIPGLKTIVNAVTNPPPAAVIATIFFCLCMFMHSIAACLFVILSFVGSFIVGAVCIGGGVGGVMGVSVVGMFSFASCCSTCSLLISSSCSLIFCSCSVRFIVVCSDIIF